MRRSFSVGLILIAAVGCKSAEDRACDNTVKITQAALASYGRSDGKNDTDHQRACLDSLSRLRQEIQPDEETWYAYLHCLQAAQDMGDTSECLAPLTAAHLEKIKADLPQPPQ